MSPTSTCLPKRCQPYAGQSADSPDKTCQMTRDKEYENGYLVLGICSLRCQLYNQSADKLISQSTDRTLLTCISQGKAPANHSSSKLFKARVLLAIRDPMLTTLTSLSQLTPWWYREACTRGLSSYLETLLTIRTAITHTAFCLLCRYCDRSSSGRFRLALQAACMILVTQSLLSMRDDQAYHPVHNTQFHFSCNCYSMTWVIAIDKLSGLVLVSGSSFSDRRE